MEAELWTLCVGKELSPAYATNVVAHTRTVPLNDNAVITLTQHLFQGKTKVSIKQNYTTFTIQHNIFINI